jgi:hypothetical protein
MLWGTRAALTVALLSCAVPGALADNDTHWLTDSEAQCAVFDGNAQSGDTVRWAGDCQDGLASGHGTAAFSRDGALLESFTATFVKGIAQDGPVVAHWGHGWSYDGNDVHGQFNGAGVLINDQGDRFEGNWIDGKMNGQGAVTRANGEHYDGVWKDDLPNGKGVLKRADGTTVAGNFIDGKLADAVSEARPDMPPDIKPATIKPTEVKLPDSKEADKAPPAALAFAGLSGKTLVGIDGSRIALTLIDGGIEREITDAGGTPKKTTYTFMTDRMGTVVEDGGPSANVTGFFRLTDNGVEVRYADGRSETLSASDDGGVLMDLDGGNDSVCRAWYPQGHAFSDADKKAALAAYASKLGLQPAAAHGGCPAAAPAAPARATAEPAPTEHKARPEKHAEARPLIEGRPLTETKPEAKPARASFTTAPRDKIADLQTVSVKNSVVHAVDGDAPIPAGVIAGPVMTAALPASPATGQRDASRCLRVESDGQHWGFRNSCEFAIQFAYCLKKGAEKLTACEAEDGRVNSVSGSVAPSGFGMLTADRSLSEKDTDHDFRWVACDGGAGEVAAHLDHAEPPGGHCDRAVTASAH